jgi:nitrile hydratase subunit alpha
VSTGDHGPSELSDTELRVRALESLLTEKGYLDSATVDAIAETYEKRIGPRNGATVVAKAWTDDDFAAWLHEDASAATGSIGFGGRAGEHVSAAFNSPAEHNLVVCTLCSCYPWPTLGLPPKWYKAPAYRSRAVREPRKLLAEMGAIIAADVEIRVWDSSAEARYLVLPMRPDGTADMSEEQLAGIVTRDSMIGVQRL